MRMSFLVHGFAIYMLYYSIFPFYIKVTGSLFLIFVLIYIVHRQGQLSAIRQVSFELEKCTLTCKNGHKLIYDTYRVVLDVGIFFLLEFSGANSRKTIVVFFDQISPSEYRSLKLLEKIR
jgi:hypothetical protein